MMSTEYEFNKEENVTIGKFAAAMTLFSIVLVLAGIATILQGVSPIDWNIIIEGITWFVIGLSFYFPIDNLRNILNTEGHDIKELMRSFSDLKRGWITALLFLIINRIFGFIAMLNALSG